MINNRQISIILLIVMVITIINGCDSFSEKNLPIMGKRELQQVDKDGKSVIDTLYHTIPNFSFVNQDSFLVTQDIFDGKIYVADFFFTTCPTICPIMKTQMLRVYEKFKDQDEVILLSHSIDPTHDTVAVLKEFAERLGVDSRKWHFVTGNKDDIYEIGEGSYMVTAHEDVDEPGGFIHSGAFILIDKERRVRGFYDGTLEKEVDRLIKDIPVLLKEYRK